MIFPPKTPRANAWTPERRAAQSAAMRRWAPWKRSTGPRTARGKAASSRNALKHGHYTKPNRDAHAAISGALRENAQFLTQFNRYLSLKRRNPQNELLNAARVALLHWGEKVNCKLFIALQRLQIMQKSCIWRPVPA